MTPKGIDKISTDLALNLPLYLGNYKGGRNESFMYGKDSQTMYYDYDLTSAYTTVMAFCGNPKYSEGEEVTED